MNTTFGENVNCFALSYNYTNPAARDNSSDVNRLLSVVSFVIIGIIAVLGNGLIIIAFSTSKEIRKIHFNTYIFNRAITDFLIGSVYVPYAVRALLQKGNELKVETGIVLIGVASLCIANTSILLTILMTIDRYQLVSDALKYVSDQSRKKIRIKIAFTWLLSTLVSILFTIAFFTGLLLLVNCGQNLFFIINLLSRAIVTFFLPLCVLLTLNIFVFYKLQVRSKSFDRKDSETAVKCSVFTSRHIGKNHDVGEVDAKSVAKATTDPQSAVMKGSSCMGISQKVHKNFKTQKAGKYEQDVRYYENDHEFCTEENKNTFTIKKLNKAGGQLFLIVFVFLICWLPHHVSFLYTAYKKWDWSEASPLTVWLELLTVLNAAINPFLYIITSKRYNKQVLLILRLKWFCSPC